MKNKLLASAALAVSMALVAGAASHAATLVTNGGFETTTYTQNHQFGGTVAMGQGVTGWTGAVGDQITTDPIQFLYFGGTETTVDAIDQYNDPNDVFKMAIAPSPDGGNFVALDGDSGSAGGLDAQGMISQVITGLDTSKTYTLTFDWGAAQLGNRTPTTITEQLQVSFGSQTFLTPILTVAPFTFSGWQVQSFTFKPTSSTQTLSFLSLGTPGGLPPMAVLDGVSLAVPEPATWGMMLLGFFGIGALIRNRSRALATA